MSNDQKDLSILSRFIVSTQSSSVNASAGRIALCLAAIWLLCFTVAQVIISADVSRFADAIIANTVAMIVVTPLLYYFQKAAIRKQRRQIDEAVGMELSGEERADLYVWFKTERLESKRLGPLRSKYLSFQEKTVRNDLNMPKEIRRIGLLTFSLFTVLAIYLAVEDTTMTGKLWHGAQALLFIAFGSMYVWTRPDGSSAVLSLLYGKRTRHIAMLRRQL